jgi:hypothetical protein
MTLLLLLLLLLLWGARSPVLRQHLHAGSPTSSMVHTSYRPCWLLHVSEARLYQ